jgi:hypothetical protein
MRQPMASGCALTTHRQLENARLFRPKAAQLRGVAAVLWLAAGFASVLLGAGLAGLAAPAGFAAPTAGLAAAAAGFSAGLALPTSGLTWA